jgi:NAD(P)H-dependent FMN reductase
MVDRVGAYVKEQVEVHGMEPIILDPEALPLEILKVPLQFYPKQEEAPEWLREADAKIRGADGFLILSAEYNCGIPPALSNLIDHFPPASYRHRPVGIVTYSMGMLGGIRAGIALRPKVSDIGMVTIPTAAMIPAVQNAFTAEGKCLEDRVAKNIGKVIEELEWYSLAIKNQRAVKAPLPGPTY